MVAGSSVLGGGHVSRSEVVGLALLLPWLVARYVLCCRVAMVAALELRSPATKDSSASRVSCELKGNALDILKHEFIVGCLLHLVLPLSVADCKLGLALDWELATTVPRQVQISAANASSSPDLPPDLNPQIPVSSSFECGARPCSFSPQAKDWTLSCTTPWFVVSSHLTSNPFGIGLATIGSTPFLLFQGWYIFVKFEKYITILDMSLLKIWLENMNCKITTQPSPCPIRCGVLLQAQIKSKARENDKFSLADHRMVLLHIDLSVKPSINLGMIYGTNEQDYPSSYCGTMLSLTDGAHVEEAVLLLFGLFHQMWMTTCLLLIPRFNSGDMSWLSSVMVHRYLQLNSSQPQVHTPDRPSGEPPAGHQLVWSTEALGDCGCGIFESELSTND